MFEFFLIFSNFLAFLDFSWFSWFFPKFFPKIFDYGRVKRNFSNFPETWAILDPFPLPWLTLKLYCSMEMIYQHRFSSLESIYSYVYLVWTISGQLFNNHTICWPFLPFSEVLNPKIMTLSLWKWSSMHNISLITWYFMIWMILDEVLTNFLRKGYSFVNFWGILCYFGPISWMLIGTKCLATFILHIESVDLTA